jgi:hypothetical protein
MEIIKIHNLCLQKVNEALGIVRVIYQLSMYVCAIFDTLQYYLEMYSRVLYCTMYLGQYAQLVLIMSFE